MLKHLNTLQKNKNQVSKDHKILSISVSMKSCYTSVQTKIAVKHKRRKIK